MSLQGLVWTGLLYLCAAVSLVGPFLYLYLYFRVVKKPMVIGKGSLKDKLVQSCPILRKRYWPTFWAFHSHLNTLIRFFLQKGPDINYSREVLTLMDGGVVALDWGVMSESSEGDDPGSGRDKPVLLILAGITGSSEETYIMHLVRDGLLTGYRPVVFNQRGYGGVPLKTLRIFCVAIIEDLREVIEHIDSKYPSSQIVAAGISLGGTNLIQYQHRLGRRSKLSAIITCGAIWDPHRSRVSLEETWINKNVYSRSISKYLSDMIVSNLPNLTWKELQKVPSLDPKKLSEAKVVSEIHSQVSVPLFGYTSLDEFYTDCSNKDQVHKIMAPLVCIASCDDPFVPYDTLPKQACECNPHTVIVLTSSGGHFGYVESFYPTGETWLDRTTRQVLTAFKSII